MKSGTISIIAFVCPYHTCHIADIHLSQRSMQIDDIVDYLSFQLLQNEDLFEELSRKWRLVSGYFVAGQSRCFIDIYNWISATDF